jgi:hypothetical protein
MVHRNVRIIRSRQSLISVHLMNKFFSFSVGITCLLCKADHSPPSEVRNAWSYAFTPTCVYIDVVIN